MELRYPLTTLRFKTTTTTTSTTDDRQRIMFLQQRWMQQAPECAGAGGGGSGSGSGGEGDVVGGGMCGKVVDAFATRKHEFESLNRNDSKALEIVTRQRGREEIMPFSPGLGLFNYG